MNALDGSPGDVRLRDVADADLPIFFEHQRDAEAIRMAAVVARDWEAFTAHWTGVVLADDTITKRTVVVDEQVAGYMVSFERDSAREVGYWIGRSYWGKGVATRALSEFLRLVTTRPLVARVAKQNVASIRVLEKCGFTEWSEATVSSNVAGDDVEEMIMTLSGV